MPPTPERPEFTPPDSSQVVIEDDGAYLDPDLVDGYLKMDSAAQAEGKYIKNSLKFELRRMFFITNLFK